MLFQSTPSRSGGMQNSGRKTVLQRSERPRSTCETRFIPFEPGEPACLTHSCLKSLWLAFLLLLLQTCLWVGQSGTRRAKWGEERSRQQSAWVKTPAVAVWHQSESHPLSHAVSSLKGSLHKRGLAAAETREMLPISLDTASSSFYSTRFKFFYLLIISFCLFSILFFAVPPFFQYSSFRAVYKQLQIHQATPPESFWIFFGNHSLALASAEPFLKCPEIGLCVPTVLLCQDNLCRAFQVTTTWFNISRPSVTL